MKKNYTTPSVQQMDLEECFLSLSGEVAVAGEIKLYDAYSDGYGLTFGK